MIVQTVRSNVDTEAVSPRPYRLGQRRQAADQTRARIVAAAREALGGEPFAGFAVDTVARLAGVARMTVYYQFGSRSGLLEALFDDLAARGGMGRLPEAFGSPDPVLAMARFVAAFCGLWASDRLVIRRLQALMVLDPDLQAASREEWRRHGARVILGRLADRLGRPAPDDMDAAVDLLHSLTSFATYDALAGADRGPEEVAALLVGALAGVIGLEPGPQER
jgi:AcrR family transcriptional regulator